MAKAHDIFSRHRSRVHFYDAIPTNDEGHLVDAVVQRWMPHASEHHRILRLQEQLLGALTPATQRVFFELEELRNEVAAEREEAYFDLGVGYGIERERRRQRFRRLGRSHTALLALGEVLAEYLESSAEFIARGRKTR